MVALARALLRDPRWPWRAAAALGGTVAGVPQYGRALTQGHGGDLRRLRSVSADAVNAAHATAVRPRELFREDSC